MGYCHGRCLHACSSNEGHSGRDSLVLFLFDVRSFQQTLHDKTDKHWTKRFYLSMYVSIYLSMYLMI